MGPRAPEGQLPAFLSRERLVLLLIAVFALGTLLLALAGGAVLAWTRLASRDNVPTTTEKPDSSGADAVVNPQKREADLRKQAEQYLNPAPGARPNPAGVNVCMELAFLYLQKHQLDDADSVFTRAESIGRLGDSYHFLGRLGRAIVLALRDKATESNDLFKKTFEPFPTGSRPPFGKGKGEREPHEIHSQLLENAQMRYWLAEAARYNEKNLVPRSAMPAALLKIYNELPAAPKP